MTSCLSAATLGIPNILLLTGDRPRFGDHPDDKVVFDLGGVQLVWTARPGSGVDARAQCRGAVAGRKDAQLLQIDELFLAGYPEDVGVVVDCGLRHLPTHVARSKLTAMVEGTVAVRRTLCEPTQGGPPNWPNPTTEQ